MIRTIILADMDSVLELVNASGMFAPDDLEEIRNRLTGYFVSVHEGLWIAYEDHGLEGIAYCIPEPMTNGAWNLLMLLVRHDRQGRGYGAKLVAHIEQLLTQARARLLFEYLFPLKAKHSKTYSSQLSTK